MAKGKKGLLEQIAVLRWPLGTVAIYSDHKYKNHFSLEKRKSDAVRLHCLSKGKVDHGKCLVVSLGGHSHVHG